MHDGEMEENKTRMEKDMAVRRKVDHHHRGASLMIVESRHVWMKVK